MEKGSDSLRRPPTSQVLRVCYFGAGALVPEGVAAGAGVLGADAVGVDALGAGVGRLVASGWVIRRLVTPGCATAAAAGGV